MKKYKGILLLIAGFFGGYLFSILLPVVLAHGGDTSLIHGCIRNNGLLAGFVRIVGANTNCANNETPLDWNAKGLPGTGAFVSTNLSGADFSFYDFRYKTIKGMDLSNTNLQSSKFNKTEVNSVNFSGSDFEYATIDNSDFTLANINNTSFKNVAISNSNFSGQDFRTVNLLSTTIQLNSNVSNANFSNKVITNALGIMDSNLSGSNFSGVDNSDSGGGTGIFFRNANLTNVNFTGAILTKTEFQDGLSNLTNANFTNANLQGMAGLDGQNLTNVIWANTTCPDGTNSDNNGNTCIGHLTP